LNQQVQQFNVPQNLPVRSPSLVAYCNADKIISDIESFMHWQRILLNSSTKSQTEKLQRLEWLVKALNEADVARSTFWRKRQAALKTLELDVDVVSKLADAGELVAAVLKIEAAVEKMQGLVDEECTMATKEGHFAAMAFETQRQFLADLKQKCNAYFTTALDNDSISCADFEAKLREATKVMADEELVLQFERLEKMQSPFLLNVVTLAGSQVDVEARRTSTIGQVKDVLAAKFGVWPYRIGLSSEDVEVLADTETLEELGICDSSVQLVVVIA
jgi:hypothetical protein